MKATDTGDEAAANQASEAMATSRSWPILNEMNVEGDYPEAFWEVADGMVDGVTDFSFGESLGVDLRQALGCDQ